MKEKNKYTIIFTYNNLITYIKYRKNNKIVYFNEPIDAEKAIESLNDGEFSLYYMAK